jgi:acyl phosphate:glycerol-3-phosphate acyltransferase
MSWIEQLHSAHWNEACGIFLSAYILGCFTAGFYLVRWIADKDIREIGSGSVGARNVSRVLGRTGFLLTVLCDFGKGMLAVWAARHFTTDDRFALLAMLAVVSGHIWPVQLRFHGGKGMATSLGSLLVYDPLLALTFGVLFVGLLAVLRKTTLPGLFALACVPLASMWMTNNHPRAVLLSFLAGLVLLAHRKNIIEEFSQFVARRQDQPEPDQPTL